MFNALPLKVSTRDGRNFVLLEPFSFTRPNGEIITVPVGAQSDGASTPRALWDIVPPFGDYWPAAYLHDYLYRYTQRPKFECDAIFLEAMESIGVEEFVRRAIYEGVALGGQAAFDADRANQT